MTENNDPGTGVPAAKRSPKALLLEMFERVVIPKNAELIEAYYHPEFTLTSNGIVQGYAEYARGHRDVYATEIRYAVRYDEDSWVESDDRVAARMWITTERPPQPPTEIEVMLIATYLDNRLYRLWELTWPDWSALEAFESTRAWMDPRAPRRQRSPSAATNGSRPVRVSPVAGRVAAPRER